MTLFSKITNALEKEDVCVISKQGSPAYVAMRWEKYQALARDVKRMQMLENQHDQIREEEDLYDIDINNIPV